ncbi:MAG: hypothetical protein AB8B49_10865, partial [Nitratireductor sp.]
DLSEKEINFFVNPKRFILFQNLLGAKLGTEIKSLLNVASGPFAFENYVKGSRSVEIDAFDIDRRNNSLFRDLRKTKQFDHVCYKTCSVEEYSATKKYDLVLINDLFYHKGVKFFDLYDKLASYVAPNGYVYFDLLDIRAQKLWSALGKNERFVRYDLNEVKAKIEESGFDLSSVTPSLGIGGKLDFAIRKLLLTQFNVANNYIFLAKRKA